MIQELEIHLVTVLTLLSPFVVLGKVDLSREYEQNFLKGLLNVSPTFTLRGSNLSDLCFADTQEYIKDLNQLQYWALQMYDSTGKLNSGLLNGNLNTYGDYEQCLSIRHPHIRGKYCLLGFDADFQKGSSYLGSMREVMDSAYSDRPFHGPEIKPPLISPLARQKFVWGFCIPSSCSLDDLESSLQQALAPLNSTENGLKIDIIPFEESCTTNLTKNFTVRSFLVMALLAGIHLLILLSTLTDHYFYTATQTAANIKEATVPMKVLLAFSLKRTVPFLLDRRKKEDDSDVSCLHGLRFLFALILFETHRSLFLLGFPLVNRTEIVRQVVEKELTMILRATMNNIDAFSLLSGLLCSYHGLARLESSGKLNVPLLYIKRYAKFTPLFLVMALMVRDLMPHFFRSPHNITVLDSLANNCENIWKVLTYTGNSDGLKDMCYSVSHQIHTDMQMYLLSPFLILFLWKFRAAAYTLISSIVVAISLYCGWIVYREKLTAVYFHGTTFSLSLESIDRLYLNTFLRLPPYLIGILVGYTLYFSKTQSKGVSKPTVVIGHTLAILGMYFSYFWLKKCAEPGYMYDALEMGLYKAAQPIMFNCALGWLIYSCFTGKAQHLNRMLSYSPYLVFSRLSYAFYMVQAGVMGALLQLNRVPLYSRLLNSMDVAYAGAVFLATVWMTLTLYLPTILIEKHLRGSKEEKPKGEINGVMSLHDVSDDKHQGIISERDLEKHM
ncbi:nose resistant to fluoxetine protein 6 [Bemisia tabaci]|uniref:nose resistant to fluoxetine protein 6 n=1 Tax=Bemisia tabaci TaxID=7038 RepID=UPI003B288C85